MVRRPSKSAHCGFVMPPQGMFLGTSLKCRYVTVRWETVVPAISTLRDEMAASGQSPLAVIGQILMAARIPPALAGRG